MFRPQELKTIKVKYVLAQKINTSLPQLRVSNCKSLNNQELILLPYDFSLNFPANLKVVTADKDIKTSSQNAILISRALVKIGKCN
jgi:hypothetical protein